MKADRFATKTTAFAHVAPRRVLVAGDSLTRVLEDEGYSVVAASGFGQLLKWVL